MTGQRIVLGGRTYLIARRQDLRSVDDVQLRREIVGACLDDLARRSAASRLVESITGGSLLGAAEIARALERLLERGAIIAVRERPPERLLDAPAVSDLRNLEPDDPTPVTPDPRPTWIELRVVGEAGLSAEGTEVRLRLPDGEQRSMRLDALATFYADEILRHGTCRVEIVGPVELTAAAQPPGVGSSGAQISIAAVVGGNLELTTGASHLVVARRPVARVLELEDACFDTAGVVFRPEAAVVRGDASETTISGLLGIGREPLDPMTSMEVAAQPASRVISRPQSTTRRTHAPLSLSRTQLATKLGSKLGRQVATSRLTPLRPGPSTRKSGVATSLHPRWISSPTGSESSSVRRIG